MRILTAKLPLFLRSPGKSRTLALGGRLSAAASFVPYIASAWILARALALAVAPTLPMGAPPSAATQAAPQGAPASIMPPLSNFNILETNNIFSLRSHTAALAAPPAPPPPPPRLNAFLMGTVDAPLPENSRAIVQFEGQQHVLRPGQALSGFTLKEVNRRAVIFEADGQRFELKADNNEFPLQIGETNNPESQSAQPDSRPGENQTAPQAAGPGVNSPPTKGTKDPKATPPPPGKGKPAPRGGGPALPKDAASVSMPGIRGLIQRGALAPTEDKQGLIVRQAPNNVLLKALKLKKGDVLTHINGKPASILSDSAKLRREIESGRLTLEVMRGGKPVKLTLSLE